MSWIRFALVACALLFVMPAMADDSSAPAKARAGGKYTTLLKSIECPQDKAKYGAFNDYGFYKKTTWCGQQAPSGYWVYVAPTWYIWKDKVPAKASAKGKYSTLLKTIKCPKDEATYGKYKDYGFYKKTKWCGQQAPTGYWVYVTPTWYIWKDKK